MKTAAAAETLFLLANAHAHALANRELWRGSFDLQNAFVQHTTHCKSLEVALAADVYLHHSIPSYR